MSTPIPWLRLAVNGRIKFVEDTWPWGKPKKTEAQKTVEDIEKVSDPEGGAKRAFMWLTNIAETGTNKIRRRKR